MLKKFPRLLGVAALFMAANADASGIYLSQFAPTDPLAAQGGTDPVYLFVIQNGNQIVGTVNATYTPPGTNLLAKVWSYAIFTTDASMSGTATLNDSFNVCNVTLQANFSASQIVVQTLSADPIPGAANPLNINCLDLYPLITRTFHLVF